MSEADVAIPVPSENAPTTVPITNDVDTFPVVVRVFSYDTDKGFTLQEKVTLPLAGDDAPSAPRDTELEEAVTPPLPRTPTERTCGRCSAVLPGLPPTCLECGTKIYHQCLYCAKPDHEPIRCHYASRHPFNKGTSLCIGCAMVCDKCEVDICADCGRTCSECEDHLCWGCWEVDEPSRVGDVCPKCQAKQGKKPKTDDQGAEANVEANVE